MLHIKEVMEQRTVELLNMSSTNASDTEHREPFNENLNILSIVV